MQSGNKPFLEPIMIKIYDAMGLLPDTQICGCACAGNAGNVFPVTAGKRSRHASRHVRHARAVMHVGIANQRFPLKSAAGENVPGIPGACATCNFTYLVRGPCGVTRPQCVVNEYLVCLFLLHLLTYNAHISAVPTLCQIFTLCLLQCTSSLSLYTDGIVQDCGISNA